MRCARVTIAVLVASCAAVAQESHDSRRSSDEIRYLGDAHFREAELAASLVNRDNDYSRRRLDHYARWERLPEWNPPVAQLRAALADAVPLAITAAARAGDRAALVELGRAAFFAYPVQDLPLAAVVDPRYGDRIAGFVRMRVADGSARLAYTCATCHSAVRDGRVVPGLGNAALDLGRLLGDADRARDRSHAGILDRWGPGRADVSTWQGLQPVRFPDLRATRYQTHLQVNATVEQRGIASLALRIETLIVTGRGGAVRPPHEVALGLALYLWSLAPPEPRAPATEAERRGRDVFDAECSRCHAPPYFTGPPVAIDEIGVDAVATSRDRGTGRWRVPSLLGVSARELLFHDGSAATLEAALDPARRAHRFGVELDPDARTALVAYLRTL